MTNAEKFIGDEDLIDQFIDEFNGFVIKNSKNVTPLRELIEQFFKQERKPILKEDERVILRNLDKKYKYISRNCDAELYLKNEADDNCRYVFRGFNHLFKFIKERRRILYRGTFERRIESG